MLGQMFVNTQAVTMRLHLHQFHKLFLLDRRCSDDIVLVATVVAPVRRVEAGIVLIQLAKVQPKRIRNGTVVMKKAQAHLNSSH